MRCQEYWGRLYNFKCSKVLLKYPGGFCINYLKYIFDTNLFVINIVYEMVSPF